MSWTGTWITAGDGKVCPDCAARHGATLPESEWQGLGLPGEGATFCGGKCVCIIVREDLLERVTGATGQAALDALGIQKPVFSMGGYEQRILREAGFNTLAEHDIEYARQRLIEELVAVDDSLVHLETKALHELVDLFGALKT